MAHENPTRGAPRVHGELRKLGLEVSERTVSRYLPKRRPDKIKSQTWLTFLGNHRHAVAAMDFFAVPTATFRVLYVFFVIHHARREIVYWNVIERPSSSWVTQQMREACPYETAPRFLLFDRDLNFNKRVTDTVKSLGITPVRTAYRSPWQNCVAERWVGTVRRELLDHVIVFGERHLRLLLRDYVAYYNRDRCHCSNAKDSPVPRPVRNKPSVTTRIVGVPRAGGLHHRYEWREAA